MDRPVRSSAKKWQSIFSALEKPKAMDTSRPVGFRDDVKAASIGQKKGFLKREDVSLLVSRLLT